MAGIVGDEPAAGHDFGSEGGEVVARAGLAVVAVHIDEFVAGLGEGGEQSGVGGVAAMEFYGIEGKAVVVEVGAHDGFVVFGGVEITGFHLFAVGAVEAVAETLEEAGGRGGITGERGDSVDLDIELKFAGEEGPEGDYLALENADFERAHVAEASGGFGEQAGPKRVKSGITVAEFMLFDVGAVGGEDGVGGGGGGEGGEDGIVALGGVAVGGDLGAVV